MDPDIKKDIDEIHSYVNSINQLMESLHARGVEVRIAYKDSANGGGKDCVPHIELWRAIEHRDYLKE
jgi:hypothetical protein